MAVALALLVLAGRLVQLQGLDAPAYALAAAKQRLVTVPLLAPRGEITDRQGRPFAVTVDARDIVTDPTLVDDKQKTAEQLSAVLHLPVDAIRRQLDRPGRFAYVARAVTPDVGRRVTALDLPGVFSVSTDKRVYPGKDLASNVVGFVGTNGSGLAGIEYAMQKQLAGVDGSRTFENGHNGRPIPDGIDVTKPPVSGSDVQLTLDRDIQWMAQQAIADEVKRSDAASGTVIVMDPRTGAVLALASSPGFDANNPGTSPPSALGNPALSDVYEPGSVNKVITMSAALQEGLFTPDSPFTVPPTYQYAGRTFHDAEVHGTEHLTLAGVLAKSSNIGTIQVAQRLGKDRLYQYLRAFGLGSKSGLGLPGESPGLLPAPKDWWDTTLPTVAFGQGVGVNAMQVASVFATIANDGVRVQPSLVAGVRDGSGTFTAAKPGPKRRVISAATATTMRNMLEAVASDQGTAPQARIQGYRVAGKTGTAQRPNGHGGYSGYTASFVGMAPADEPQLVVSVVVQDPKNGHFGGTVAAPVFHDVMSFALQSLKIPPTGTRPPVARLTW